jgi:hypothetical protein
MIPCVFKDALSNHLVVLRRVQYEFLARVKIEDASAHAKVDNLHLHFTENEYMRYAPTIDLQIHVRTVKNGVFWDVTPCGSCKNRRFGGT